MISWYHKATEQGHSPSQAKLSAMYMTDKSIPQDDVIAYALLNLVSISDNDTRNLRDLLVKRMTPEQIQQGQLLAKKLSRLGNFKNAYQSWVNSQEIP